MVEPLLGGAWLADAGYELQPSAFLPFAPYSFPLLEWLAALADELHFEIDWDLEDEDWEMDCQDVQDVLSLLDCTGNLDAPL